MRTLRTAILATLALVGGGIIGMLAPAPRVAQAVAPTFGDVYSRPISLNPTAPRKNQLFHVYHAFGNAGPQRADNVVLTIHPIQDPLIQYEGFALNVSGITCTGPTPGTAGPGLPDIVCTFPSVGYSLGIILADVRYTPFRSGPATTSQDVSASNDPNPANNTASKTFTIS